MPKKVPETKLRERGNGFELSGFEQTMIFQKEDWGYVRWINRQMGMYYLDPSPFKNTPYDEIYVSPLNNLPPREKLISVTVRETDTYNDLDPISGKLKKFTIKIVTGYEIKDPNDIRGNRLLNSEEFMNAASLPISERNLPFENIRECLGMYLVASPKISIIEPGGINTVILGTHQKHDKWLNFKRMTSVIPKEFRYITSKNFYKSIENGAIPNPRNSNEVSLAFLNREDAPIQIPMPFEDLEFKPFSSYKEDFYERMPMAKAFVLDSLLYTPEIKFGLRRRVEEYMVFMVEEVLASEDMPCYQDVGSAATRLTMSIARLNFKMFATLKDLKEGVALWFEAMELSKKQQQKRGGKRSNMNKKASSPKADQLFEELKILNDADVPLTLANVKGYTKLSELDFEEALFKLKMAGKIYFPTNDLMALIPF